MKLAFFGDKLKQLAKKLWHYNDNDVPKGYFPVDVIGEADTAAESKVVRYVVSLKFLHCKYFSELLDEYKDDIKLRPRGPTTLPCSVRKFEIALHRDRLHSRIKNFRSQV